MHYDLSGTHNFTLADANKYLVIQSVSNIARSLILPANPTNGLRYIMNIAPNGGTWNASIYYSGGITLISTGAFASGSNPTGFNLTIVYSTAISRWCRF